MSYMNHSEFFPAGGIQELNFDEIEDVFAGSFWHDAANTLMAVGAAGAGVGTVTAQPEIVAVSAVIAGVGGIIYLVTD